MRINDLKDYAPDEAIAAYFLEKSRPPREGISGGEGEDALKKVEEAQQSNTRTTLQMMDRHSEMVRKSQELARTREKKRAIEHQNEERRQEQTELMARAAVHNAERRDLMETLRLRAEA
ncbi:MAG: hypothetical protein LBQ90_08310 [Synergistaceae bacterium]|jgi:hypothetical protein|nr:hypothetical protein [Synergistaceae bacterium]